MSRPVWSQAMIAEIYFNICFFSNAKKKIKENISYKGIFRCMITAQNFTSVFLLEATILTNFLNCMPRIWGNMCTMKSCIESAGETINDMIYNCTVVDFFIKQLQNMTSFKVFTWRKLTKCHTIFSLELLLLQARQLVYPLSVCDNRLWFLSRGITIPSEVQNFSIPNFQFQLRRLARFLEPEFDLL